MVTRRMMLLLSFVTVVGCDSCGSDQLGCSSDDDCKGVRMCMDGTCETPGADSTQNNGPGANNDIFAPDCAEECTGDNLCASGECRPVCNSDEECGEGFACAGRIEGPGAVCWEGYRCMSEGGMISELRCEMDFSCGEGGQVKVLCAGDGQMGGHKECECLIDNEVESTFSWEGSVCDLAHVGDSVPYLCEFDTLFFR